MKSPLVMKMQKWWIDVAIVTAILSVWMWRFAEPVAQRLPVMSDTFRDSAHVHNILKGYVWADPSTRGFSYWYAPGSPLLCAAISAWTGVDPLEIYAYSILVCNVWIPVGWYLLVRFCWNRWTGVLTLVLVMTCSRWWQSHVAGPMPSIQGMVFVVASFAVWQWVMLRGRYWTVVLGVVLALCTWFHILSGMIASATIVGHALLQARRGDAHRAVIKRAAGAAAICAILVSPLAWDMLNIPVRNAAPPTYFAPQLADVGHALHSATPLFLPVALAGMLGIAREQSSKHSWIWAYLLVGLAGQVPAYIRFWFDWPLPRLLPHEFQWHAHVALGVSASVVVVSTCRRLVSGIRRPMVQNGAMMTSLAIFVALIAGPDRLRGLDKIEERWISARWSSELRYTLEWIRRNTGIQDVIVARYLPAFYEIAGGTGRKLILMPELRANMAVDVRARRNDLYRLENTRDPQEFLDIAVHRHGAEFVFLTPEYRHLLERWRQWSIMEPAYRSPTGERMILRIVDVQTDKDAGRSLRRDELWREWD